MMADQVVDARSSRIGSVEPLRRPGRPTWLPDGCGLKTSVLPAAIMLMALPASVGSECVTGVITPITPKGACSIERQAVVAAERFGAEHLDARDALADAA